MLMLLSHLDNKSGSTAVSHSLACVSFSLSLPLQVRELIYREILEYHPTMLADYLQGGKAQPNFMYPSAVDNFKRQFAQLESSGGRGGVAVGGIGQVLRVKLCY